MENLFNTLNAKKIHYSRNKFVTTGIGTDVNYLVANAQKSGPEYFLYLGLIRKHKAVLELVKTFANLSEKLVVAGPLKDIPYCKEVISEIDKYPNITYYGEVKIEDEGYPLN
uniref:Glycosyltransferase n=1 Tax=candidate division WWE3 bacterium TaxID=2053526 RepID=A0A7C4TM04_UNCKA